MDPRENAAAATTAVATAAASVTTAPAAPADVPAAPAVDASAVPAAGPEPRAGFGVSSFTLKVAAIVCMTANHSVWLLGAIMPEWLYYLLFCLGGATFPIMAFMLVEGYRHTSNLKRYAGRLLLWAAIAAVPFFLFLGQPESNYFGNVLFTLFLGLCIVAAKDRCSTPIFLAVLVAGVGLSYFCDWGLVGPLVVLAYYMLDARPGNPVAIVVVVAITICYSLLMALDGMLQLVAIGWSLEYALPLVLPNAMYGLVGGGIAAALLCLYNGKLGRPLAGGSAANRFNLHTLVKWGFYAYYPLHITVLGLVAMTLGLR